MAKYVKTPPIDIKPTRKVFDKKTEKTSIEESLESRLLKDIDEMLEKGIPLTKTRLANRTGIKGGSFNTYAAIFDDTIDMIRMFELGTKDKTGEFASVPNFDRLEAEVTTLIKQHAKRIDYLNDLYLDMEEINPEIDTSKKQDELYNIVESYFGFIFKSSYIHPAFAGVNSIDDITKLIETKYEYNQKLWRKYKQLKRKLKDIHS